MSGEREAAERLRVLCEVLSSQCTRVESDIVVVAGELGFRRRKQRTELLAIARQVAAIGRSLAEEVLEPDAESVLHLSRLSKRKAAVAGVLLGGLVAIGTGVGEELGSRLIPGAQESIVRIVGCSTELHDAAKLAMEVESDADYVRDFLESLNADERSYLEEIILEEQVEEMDEKNLGPLDDAYGPATPAVDWFNDEPGEDEFNESGSVEELEEVFPVPDDPEQPGPSPSQLWDH